MTDENRLLERITYNPNIFGGKPIIRGKRLAVEHVLGMLAAGDTPEIILQGYTWLQAEDIQACLVYGGLNSTTREPRKSEGKPTFLT